MKDGKIGLTKEESCAHLEIPVYLLMSPDTDPTRPVVNSVAIVSGEVALSLSLHLFLFLSPRSPLRRERNPPGRSHPSALRQANKEKMERFSLNLLLIILGSLSALRSAIGIRFVIDREECFSHSVPYEGDKVHFSFVVIKADTPWHYGDDGVDLVVKGPTSDQIYDARDKISDKFEFVVQRKGVHRFCFTNKSPYHETIDFDVHIGHFSYFDEHAKDEHLNPLLEQIGKLEEALYNIQFEQHWLEAQTDRQALVNEGMSRRAVHKALIESAALVGASVLQVFLLRRLFERKLGTSRV